MNSGFGQQRFMMPFNQMMQPTSQTFGQMGGSQNFPPMIGNQNFLNGIPFKK